MAKLTDDIICNTSREGDDADVGIKKLELRQNTTQDREGLERGELGQQGGKTAPTPTGWFMRRRTVIATAIPMKSM